MKCIQIDQFDPHLSSEHISKTRPETPAFFTFPISICPNLSIDVKNIEDFHQKDTVGSPHKRYRLLQSL